MSIPTITVPNTSRFFNPWKDRTHISVPDSKSFSWLRSKKFGYYVRMYYEYKYTLDQAGKVVFLTFTYNDNSMPRFNGIPCVDNSHLRWLLHDSRLFKRLKSCGYSIKYIVTSEFGEGKGKRGYGQNPHYHGLFFVTRLDFRPVTDKDVDYIVGEFRYYWQGNRYKASRSNDPRKFTFGKVDVSSHGASVSDFRALAYTSKYTIKDVDCNTHISQLADAVKSNVVDELLNKMLNLLDMYTDETSNVSAYCLPSTAYKHDVLFRDWFNCKILPSFYGSALHDFAKVHFPKVHMSKGFGKYALNFVDSDYKISVPTAKGVKRYFLPQYLYRLLFYDVVKVADNNKYVLNARGIQFRRDVLPVLIQSMHDTALSVARLNNYPVTSDVCHEYAVYKCVYEYRMYYADSYPDINWFIDFDTFIQPSYYDTFLNEPCYRLLIETTYKNRAFLPFSCHPHFKPYIDAFSKLDCLLDNYYRSCDDSELSQYLLNKRVQNFHSPWTK